MDADLSCASPLRLTSLLDGERDVKVFWRAVAMLLERRDFPALAAISATCPAPDPFTTALMRTLALVPEAGLSGAISSLAAPGDSGEFGPFERMCARAWGAYLSRPRFAPGVPADMPRLWQFWDRRDPPREISACFREWREIRGRKA